MSFIANNGREILSAIDLDIPKGSFVAVLGENGAGKTTLLDLLMGFKRPSTGSIEIFEREPHSDPYQDRERISYLSEKMDLPADWDVNFFLEFNRFFFSNYSLDKEKDLIKEFGVDLMNRIGNLSAGEVRRTQIIASLAVPRDLVIIDEITAVLDIVGRKKCMRVLDQERRDRGTTIVLATNILEDVHLFATHILLLSRGKVKSFASLDSFLSGSDRSHFSDRVVYELETK
jgi:ABC-2 type transport system ATP-binding protein